MRIPRQPLITAFIMGCGLVTLTSGPAISGDSAAVPLSSVQATVARSNLVPANLAQTSQAQTNPAQNKSTKPEPVAAKLPLEGVDVLVDPGHGGTDPGAMRAGIEEKNITLGVSLSLRHKLVLYGAKVEMTRDRDVPVALLDRLDDSNKLCPDLFLSVHVNAVARTSVRGIETYYFDKRGENLAHVVLGTLSTHLGEKANWSHERSLRVLHGNRAPATLAEIGYLTNPASRVRLSDPAYQNKVADALAASLIAYFATPGAPRGCQQ